MESSGKGKALLDLFSRLGCPDVESLNGEDLDWVWDYNDETKERDSFLKWITTGGPFLTRERNVLTDAELRMWEEMRRSDPTLLSGQHLEEAVRRLEEGDGDANANREESDSKGLNDEALDRLLTEKRCQVDAMKDRLQELQKLLSLAAAKNSRLALNASNLEKTVADRLNGQILTLQQRLFHLSEKHNSLSQGMVTKLVQLEELLRRNFVRKHLRNSTFFSSCDKQPLVEQDSEVSSAIQKLATGFVDARSEEEQRRKLTSTEHERLSDAFRKAERNRVFKKAEAASAAAAAVAIKEQTSKLANRGAEEIPLLRKAVDDLDVSVIRLDKMLTSLLKDKLPVHVRAKAEAFTHDIQLAEVEAELKRETGRLKVTDQVVELLIQQTVYQEVSGLLLAAETSSLNDLKAVLGEIGNRHREEAEADEKAEAGKDRVEQLLLRTARANGDGPFLMALRQMLTTHGDGDVAELASDFADRSERLEAQVRETQEQWQSRKHQVETTLDKIRSQLRITNDSTALSGGGGVGIMTKPELTNKLKETRVKIDDLQSTVKDRLCKLEKTKLELKANPAAVLEKRLGAELMNLS